MLMGYVEMRISQDQQEDENEVCQPKSRWVSCPNMPDGLLTVDDETPHRVPKEAIESE